MNHPERLGKYPITGVLGQGAMGVVYRALDPVIQRQVAIKTVHKALLRGDADTGSDYAERFRNEARSAGRLAHPGIVAVHEYGEDADAAYIVMEYVEGETLAQWLARTPLPGEDEVLALMDQLLAALACAHAQGVWHRDIKPANLMVTPDGRLKITDFGIARIANVALTHASALVGTPGSMAPEQYTGAPIDQRVDVFAAGVLLYRLLAGRPAFSGSAEAVMFQILHEQPAPPSTHAGRSPAWDAVVARALAKDPAQRHASAAAMREALAEVRELTVVLPRVPAPRTAVTAAASARLAPELLEHATCVLATQVGPIARVLVRQASGRAQSAEQLYRLLADDTAGGGIDRERLLARLRAR